jgi:hypothetical protein
MRPIIGEFSWIISECGRILVFQKITVPFTHQTRFNRILANFTNFFWIFQKSTKSATSKFFALSNTRITTLKTGTLLMVSRKKSDNHYCNCYKFSATCLLGGTARDLQRY